MKRYRDIVGLPIVTIDTGETIGRVEDVIYSMKTRYLEAIVVSKAGWLRDAEVITLDNIIGMGADAITIGSEGCVQELKELPHLLDAVDEISFSKQRVMTSDGRLLGIVQDVIFDNGGKMHGIEVSEGLLSDLVSGRKCIPLPEVMVLNGDNCIVDEVE